MNKREYRLIGETADDEQGWNSVAGHPMQSREWADFRVKRQKISRLGIYEKGKLTGCFLIVWTKIGPTPWSIGYIPMGKIPDERDLAELKRLAKTNRAIGIRMEPDIQIQTANAKKTRVPAELKPGRSLFKKQTIILDLTKSEEQLLERMHPKARYNIRVAQKHGVTVQRDDSDQAFERYLELMFSGTVKRQKIFMHDTDYHRQMREVLGKSGVAQLWTAKYKETIVAADLIFEFGRKIYYAFGATTLEHKEIMAPTLLIWEIARWGKSAGKESFDLWGTEEGKGFSRFKEQFGGEIVSLPGSFDLIINPCLYRIFRIAEEVRWQILHKFK